MYQVANLSQNLYSLNLYIIMTTTKNLSESIKNLAVIYCRVSSKEQEENGYSLDSQEKLLKGYAEKNGYVIKKIYRIAESASGKQVRKIFDEMLAYISKNKVNIILCEKIDRLTRNLKDAAIVSDWIHGKENREVHFVKENFIVNQNTRAHENLVWDMKVAIARFYINNLSEEVKKGQKEKISQGGYPCKSPRGYTTIGEKGHKIHIPDKPVANLIIKMFELYSSGNLSINALVDIMYREGLRTENGTKLTKSMMHHYLRNPFYCGKFYWNGKLSDGKHEPIISGALFNLVQSKLNRSPENPQYKKHLPIFKAKIKCGECGGTISWSKRKGHWYGRCNHFRKCSQRGCIRQEDIEKQLFPHLDKIMPKSEKILNWIKKALKEDHSKESENFVMKRAEYTKRYDKLTKLLDQMYIDSIEGEISKEYYHRKKEEFIAEQKIILSELEKLGEDNIKYFDAGYSVAELATKATAIYNSKKATIDDKRLLLSYIISDCTLKYGKLAINFTLAFNFLSNNIPLLEKNFGPQRNASTDEKTEVLSSVRSQLLPGSDSNRRPTR